MATVPVPKTWVEGEDVPTAADLNSQIRDAMAVLLNPPAVKVIRTTDLPVPSVATTVTWDSEVWDTDGMWSSGSDITLVTLGVYRIHVNVSFSTSDDGDREVSIEHRSSGGSLIRAYRASRRAFSNPFEGTTTVHLVAAAGDKVRVVLDSDAAVTADTVSMSVRWMSTVDTYGGDEDDDLPEPAPFLPGEEIDHETWQRRVSNTISWLLLPPQFGFYSDDNTDLGGASVPSGSSVDIPHESTTPDQEFSERGTWIPSANADLSIPVDGVYAYSLLVATEQWIGDYEIQAELVRTRGGVEVSVDVATWGGTSGGVNDSVTMAGLRPFVAGDRLRVVATAQSGPLPVLAAGLWLTRISEGGSHVYPTQEVPPPLVIPDGNGGIITIPPVVDGGGAPWPDDGSGGSGGGIRIPPPAGGSGGGYPGGGGGGGSSGYEGGGGVGDIGGPGSGLGNVIDSIGSGGGSSGGGCAVVCYIQPNEPPDVPNGTLWWDTDDTSV